MSGRVDNILDLYSPSWPALYNAYMCSPSWPVLYNAYICHGLYTCSLYYSTRVSLVLDLLSLIGGHICIITSFNDKVCCQATVGRRMACRRSAACFLLAFYLPLSVITNKNGAVCFACTLYFYSANLSHSLASTTSASFVLNHRGLEQM